MKDILKLSIIGVSCTIAAAIPAVGFYSLWSFILSKIPPAEATFALKAAITCAMLFFGGGITIWTCFLAFVFVGSVMLTAYK